MARRFQCVSSLRCDPHNSIRLRSISMARLEHRFADSRAAVFRPWVELESSTALTADALHRRAIRRRKNSSPDLNPPNVFMRGIVGQPLRLPNQNWQVMRLPCNFILARRPQNRAPVFALRLRMRCYSHVRTRTRSRNHRRDSLRGGFSNPQRWAP